MLTEDDKQAIADRVLQGLLCAPSATPQLTPQEVEWIRLAIQREAQIIKFRNAVIEKTLMGLVLFLLAGLGYLILDSVKSHLHWQ